MAGEGGKGTGRYAVPTERLKEIGNGGRISALPPSEGRFPPGSPQHGTDRGRGGIDEGARGTVSSRRTGPDAIAGRGERSRPKGNPGRVVRLWSHYPLSFRPGRYGNHGEREKFHIRRKGRETGPDRHCLPERGNPPQHPRP